MRSCNDLPALLSIGLGLGCCYRYDLRDLCSCREVGTVIRSLGCYPSEADLQDMLQEVEEEEPTGTEHVTCLLLAVGNGGVV